MRLSAYQSPSLPVSLSSFDLFWPDLFYSILFCSVLFCSDQFCCVVWHGGPFTWAALCPRCFARRESLWPCRPACSATRHRPEHPRSPGWPRSECGKSTTQHITTQRDNKPHSHTGYNSRMVPCTAYNRTCMWGMKAYGAMLPGGEEGRRGVWSRGGPQLTCSTSNTLESSNTTSPFSLLSK